MKEPNYLFSKILIVLMAIILVECEVFLLTSGNLFYFTGFAISISFIAIAIWLIDWEANLYYKYLKRRGGEKSK